MKNKVKPKAAKIAKKTNKKSFLDRIEPERITNPLAFSLFVITVLYWTAIHNSYILTKIEKLSLFLPTKYFFLDNMNAPGGFLTYLGAFLTQFFHYPWLGSLIFIGLLLLVAYLVKISFKIDKKALPLCFIPSFLLLLVYSQLGYYIYVNQTPGVVFVNIIGIIFTLLGIWFYKSLKLGTYRVLFCLLFVLILYPLVGFYAVITGLIGGIMELAQNRKKSIVNSVIILIGTALIPFLYYRIVYTHLRLDSIYTSGILLFKLEKRELIYWLPIGLLCVSLLVFSVASAWNISWNKVKVKNRILLSFAVFLGINVFVWARSFNDESYRIEIQMLNAIFENEWDEVLELAEYNNDEPTRLIVMMTNLALQKSNLAGDKMFTYPNGYKVPQFCRKIKAIRMAGIPIFYHYAQLNYAYHWCMENSVEYGYSYETLQYMVKIAIFNREYELAQKYNDVLKETLYYKNWANEYQKYIDKPTLVKEWPEYNDLQELYLYMDNIGGDHTMLESYIVYSMADLNHGSKKMLELSLQYNMLLRDADNFWPRFEFYVDNHDRIPVHYQEAVLLYAYFEKKDINHIKLDKQVVQRFQKSLKLGTTFNRMTEKEAREIYGEQFGDTYWYYYFFLKGLKIEKNKN